MAIVIIFAFFVTQGQSDSLSKDVDGVLSTTSTRYDDRCPRECDGRSYFGRLVCCWKYKLRYPRPPQPPRPPEPSPTPTPISPDPDPTPVPPNPASGYSGYVRINTSNYSSLGSTYTKANAPFIVSAMFIGTDVASMTSKFNTEMSKLAAIKDTSVLKWISFSSYEVANKILTAKGPSGYATNADYIKSIGIKGVSYNTENEYTPAAEMSALFSTNAASNSVAKFGTLAKNSGLKGYWAPLRHLADQGANNPQALKVMYSTGLTGIALQEQKFVETQCASDRIAAVKSTYKKYQDAVGSNIELSVQIMPSRCQTGDSLISKCKENISGSTYKFQHCDIFVEGIKNDADIIAIWATASGDTSQLDELIDMIRD